MPPVPPTVDWQALANILQGAGVWIGSHVGQNFFGTILSAVGQFIRATH